MSPLPSKGASVIIIETGEMQVTFGDGLILLGLGLLWFWALFAGQSGNPGPHRCKASK